MTKCVHEWELPITLTIWPLLGMKEGYFLGGRVSKDKTAMEGWNEEGGDWCYWGCSFYLKVFNKNSYEKQVSTMLLIS